MRALLPILMAVTLAAPTPAATPPIDVDPPRIAMPGVPAKVALSADVDLRVELRDAQGRVVASGELRPGAALELELRPSSGAGRQYTVTAEGFDEPLGFALRVVPGWLTLLPPLLAIVLALVFRQVVLALLAGVWAGAWLFHAGPFVGALRTIDRYVVGALADGDHVAIIVFSLLLGGMVGIVSRSGGTVGLVDALRPYATDSRRGQLITWMLGIVVFFDDYANTLLVGNTMRPVTDRLRISREKLAYIVDSTAAPVASIMLVSTWIGYEVSLIGDSLREIGSAREAYTVFLRSLPYNFYPLLALVFGLLVATSLRDFGPMARAEKRARDGKLLADGAVPLADFGAEGLRSVEGKPRRAINAVLPIAVVLLVTFWGLWYTGRLALLDDGQDPGAVPLFQLFSAGDSYRALLYGSMSGCLVALVLAVGQRVLTLAEGLAAWTAGVKSMTPAIVILTLAWAIADICSELDTRGFLVSSLSEALDPRLLPAIVFLLASVTSFATGTAWGTMGLLIPLAVPTGYALAQAAGFDPSVAERIFVGSVSSVLAGAIFGDHCSPISDTTVLSSMSTSCDHVDHVRTQLPYALVVAGVAILFGYLPSGYGLSPLLCLVICSGALALLLFGFGRRALDVSSRVG